jgi:hypothetical protein
MSRIFAIHEYELRIDTDSQEWKKSKYTVLWIFKSQEVVEELFGTEEKPKRGPVNFVNFENNILSKFLDRPADKIVFTDYWEFASRISHHDSVRDMKVT